MGKRDRRVDVYIEKAEPFARPILRHLRGLVHQAVPAVEEAIKWGAPHFLHRGMLCNMAAFTQHCAFGFWKGNLVLDGNGDRSAMGHLGRIATLADLPPDEVLRGYLRKAAALNVEGVRPPRAPAKPKPPVRTPADFAAALRGAAGARATFQGFSPSHKREYVEWITDAKSDATRQRRIETAIAWLAAGKVRNWKYVSGGSGRSR